MIKRVLMEEAGLRELLSFRTVAIRLKDDDLITDLLEASETVSRPPSGPYNILFRDSLWRFLETSDKVI